MDIPADLIRQLRAARCVTVSTGAGVSVESGVPTFRDRRKGLWEKYNPEELSTPRAFLRNPRLVWEWYAWLRRQVAAAQPNAAHHAVARLATLFPQFHLITQNIDGLHQRAGSPHVIELHGNITRSRCFNENTVFTTWDETGGVPPKCPDCGGWLRPDVVWFEEPLPEVEIEQAGDASAGCDVFLSIGTSVVVYPAAALPFEALRSGATVVEINPHPTALSDAAHFVLPGPAGTVLPELLKAFTG